MNVKSQGRDSIIEMLKTAASAYQVCMHSFQNPTVDVEGDNAKGKYLLWVAVKTEDKANVVYQSEDVEYVRGNEGWLISRISLHFAQKLIS